MAKKVIAMVKKALAGLVFLTLLSAFSQWEGVEYTVTEPQITFAWDAVENADHYKVRVVWIDPAQEFSYPIGNTTQTQLDIQRPRAGHFRFEVAACNGNSCSEWATSEANGQVDGVAKGWKVYWRIPPPQGPVID